MKLKLLLPLLSLLMLSCNGSKLKQADVVPGTENTVLIPTQNQQGLWGFVDESKNWQILPGYADAWLFSKGMAVVAKEPNKYGVINRNEEWVIKPKYEAASTYTDPSGSLYFLLSSPKKSIILNEQGELIAQTSEFVMFSNPIFSEERLMLRGKNDKLGFIDRKGKWVVEPKYEFGSEFSEGLASMADEQGRLLIDASGKEQLRFPPEVEYTGKLSSGLMPVRKNGKYGYADRQGKMVIDFEYDNANEFTNGLAVVYKGNTILVIDTNNTPVLQPDADLALSLNNGYLLVAKGGKSGLMDTNGKLVLGYGYDTIFEPENGYIRVKQNNNQHYINLSTGVEFR